MRRILFTALASAAMFAAVPTGALAHDGKDHHARHHHRVRHEHFVGRHDVGNPGNTANAGTVTAFGNGMMTITLANGNAVTGAVTNATEIKCDSPRGDNDNDNDRGDRVNEHAFDHGGDNGDNGGDNDGDRGDRGDDQQMCGTIAVGMAVRQASLTVTSAGAVWNEVELINS
jgi:hypothetical protein